jgi:hypothetical protein
VYFRVDFTFVSLRGWSIITSSHVHCILVAAGNCARWDSALTANSHPKVLFSLHRSIAQHLLNEYVFV